MDVKFVAFVNQYIRKIVRLHLRQKVFVVIGHAFGCAILVAQTIFDDASVSFDIGEMFFDIAFAHDQANISDVRKIFFRKVLFPIERNIATLDDEILIVFDGGFYHFPNDGPQIFRELIVFTHGCELRLLTADQTHFQMIDRQIGETVFFKQPLRKCGFPGVRGTRYQNDHGYFPFLDVSFHAALAASAMA